MFTDRRFEDDLPEYIKFAILCHRNNECSIDILEFLLKFSSLRNIEYILNNDEIKYLIIRFKY